MTDAQLEDVENLIRDWQTILGLADWTFEVRPIKSKKTMLGQAIIANYGYRSAIIKINPQPDDDFWSAHFPLEVTIVHELLHVVMHETRTALLAQNKELPEGSQGYLWDQIHRCIESDIERLARAMVAIRHEDLPIGGIVRREKP